MVKYKLHIIWAAVAVVALVGGIFWGRGMAAGAGGGKFAGGGNFTSSTRAFARNGSGSVFAGQISAIDSSSITLQLPNGNSEVVFYSSSTPVTEPTTVSVSKLTTGSNVAVVGTQNSDGSVTAQAIQVGGANGGFRGGAGAGASASGSL